MAADGGAGSAKDAVGTQGEDTLRQSDKDALRQYSGPYPGAGRCQAAIILATEYSIGFGAVVATISPVRYQAALKMRADDAAGLLIQLASINKELQVSSTVPSAVVSGTGGLKPVDQVDSRLWGKVR